MTGTTSKRTWLALGILVVLLIASLAWWLNRPARDGEQASVPPPSAEREAAPALDATAVAPRDVVPAKTEPVVASTGPVVVRVHVLDAQFRVPLRAWVACTGRRWLVTRVPSQPRSSTLPRIQKLLPSSAARTGSSSLLYAVTRMRPQPFWPAPSRPVFD